MRERRDLLSRFCADLIVRERLCSMVIKFTWEVRIFFLKKYGRFRRRGIWIKLRKD